jgi:predicted RNA-binding Zn-ribbon protein involved in translation (DUF1610 family)
MTESDTGGKLWCPECGYDGAMDGRGRFTRNVTRINPHGTRVSVCQLWAVFGCTDCGTEYAIREDIKT